MIRNSVTTGKTSGIFVFLSLLLLCQLAWAEEKKAPIVAVFDIDGRGVGLQPSTLDKLTDFLIARLAEGGYNVVPKQQIRELLLEQKKESYKHCYDESCQIELGRELSAQKGISTKILKIGNKCQLSAVVYDLKRSATEQAETEEADCDEKSLLGAVKKVSRELVASLKNIYPMNPYKTWGHVAIWSGLGLVTLGSVAAIQADAAAKDHEAGDQDAASRSRSWAGVCYTSFGVGGALLVTGVVLWLLSPGDRAWAERSKVSFGFSADGTGLTLNFSGRW